tara:strand:+ start:284 stop:865 length:582 start_codon:yes stop_codon:yes gene_type:complete
MNIEKKYIYNAVNFDTAIEVNNYPWGFRLKTKVKYWIESNNKGDRFIKQTLNPKTNKWCNPKKSTYNAVEVLYFDENNHVKSYGIGKYGTNEEELKTFISNIDYNSLNLLQKKQIEMIKSINKVMENVSFKIEKVSEYNLSNPLDLIRMRKDNNSAETKAKEKEQNIIKNKIINSINSTYNQSLIKNNLKGKK